MRPSHDVHKTCPNRRARRTVVFCYRPLRFTVLALGVFLALLLLETCEVCTLAFLTNINLTTRETKTFRITGFMSHGKDQGTENDLLARNVFGLRVDY
jgi:hypothetical protein